MKSDINNVTIKFNCQQDWDAMTDCKSGKVCTGCNKTVFDFTDKKQDYFDAILSENKGKVCGKFTFSQMSAVQNFQKAAVIATSLLATDAFTQTDMPIHTPPKLDTITKQKQKNEEYFLGTIVEPQPEFKGGPKAMFQFLSENIKMPKFDSIKTKELNKGNHTVYIGYTVSKKGEIKNVMTKKGIKGFPQFEEEAMRVVKLMDGKWTAGKQNGEFVDVNYTLPLKFKIE
jgi:Gram-negative bacterial TonB protein C-terminal